MKFLLQTTSLVAMASMALAQTSSSSTASGASSSSAAAASSSSAAAASSSSAAAASSSSAAAASSSSAAAASSSSAAAASSSLAQTASGTSSAAQSTSTAGFPGLPSGDYYAFDTHGGVYVVIPSQAKMRKRQTPPPGSPSLQDCINQCGNLGPSQCTQVIYNTAATSAAGVCSTGLFTCSPPPAGTTEAVLVGTSSGGVNVPTCILQPNFAAAASGSVSGSVSSSASATVVTSLSVSGSSTVTVSVTSASASASSSAVAGLAPVCPGDNGKTVTVQGLGGATAFTIVCGAGTVGKVRRSITDGGLVKRQAAGNAFGICITSCANTPGCQSLLFNPANGACALYDCVVAVPAGLSGAVRVGASTTCPPNTPTSVPVVNNNINLNLNISVNVNVNINAGTFQGLPYTQVCTSACSPCPVCTPLPPSSCSICQQKGAPAPLAPQPYWYQPACPGQQGYPAYCSTCNLPAPQPVGPSYPVSPAPVAGSSPGAPAAQGTTGGSTGSTTSPASGVQSGKYTGPYSNDAAGVKAAGSLIAGAIALAFAFA